jgi:hypothetical protein
MAELPATVAVAAAAEVVETAAVEALVAEVMAAAASVPSGH